MARSHQVTHTLITAHVTLVQRKQERMNTWHMASKWNALLTCGTWMEWARTCCWVDDMWRVKSGQEWLVWYIVGSNMLLSPHGVQGLKFWNVYVHSLVFLSTSIYVKKFINYLKFSKKNLINYIFIYFEPFNTKMSYLTPKAPFY